MKLAITFITLALVFYSYGVWSEFLSMRLKQWHVCLFWLGFVFDTAGTKLMYQMSEGFSFNVHGISGLIAIILMLLHAVWATVVVIRKNARALLNFHKFSRIVWFIWLIPFLSGMLMGMIR